MASPLGEEKALLRAFSVDSYKTVPITPPMLCEEVERALRKRMIVVGGEAKDFEAYRLFAVFLPDKTEVLVQPKQVVWPLLKEKNGKFLFKIPEQVVDTESYSSPALSPPPGRSNPKKLSRQRSASKVHQKRIAEAFDDGLGVFRKGGHHGQKDRSIWIKYKDMVHQHTFQPNLSWDSHLEQICAGFDLKDEAHLYTLQVKMTGLYLNSVADLFESPNAPGVRGDVSIILTQKPEIEIKKIIEMTSGFAEGASVRDGLKRLWGLAMNEATQTIILLFLQYQGFNCLLNILRKYQTHPSDTILLTLKLLEMCITIGTKPPPSSPSSPSSSSIIPPVKIEGDAIQRLTKLMLTPDNETSGTLRMEAGKLVISVIKTDKFMYSFFLDQLEQISMNAEDKASRHVIFPLLHLFVGSLQGGSDILLEMLLLNLITLVIQHSPKEKTEEMPPQRSKQEIIKILFDNFTFGEQIHTLAVTPGRIEVEEALLAFQAELITAWFWEKDITFRPGNEDDEALLMQLWTLTYPDIPLKNRVSKQWGKLGFQSDDPVRDFRAMGMLGLKHLIFVTKHDNRNFREICETMSSQTENFYPIATAGMMISQMLCAHIKNIGMEKLIPCLFDGVEPVGQMYCVLTRELFRIFNDRNAGYMDFSNIQKEFQGIFEDSLERCNTVQQLAKQIAAYDDDSYTTIRTTAVYEWGHGSISSPTMEQLGTLMSKPVLCVAASSHVIVVTETDGVWGWGASSCGQLGIETTEKRLSSPQFLENFTSKQITRVFVGDGRSAGTTSMGELWMCGEQIPAQNGDPSQSVTLRRVNCDPTGDAVSGVTKVSFGQFHGAILVRSEKSGKIYTWGHNTYYQLGHSDKGRVVEWPSVVSGLTNVVSVSAGRNFCVAVGSDKTVHAWGQNVPNKQTGTAILGTSEKEKEFIDRPKRVGGFKAFFHALADVSCGATHSVLLSKKGAVFTWGEGKGGRLGLGSEEHAGKPKEVQIEPCTQVCAGYNYTVAIGRSGKLYTWGDGGRGSLGHGDLNDCLIPKELLMGGKPVKCEKISAGASGITVAVMMFDLPSVSGSVFGVPLAKLMHSRSRKGGQSVVGGGGPRVPYVVERLCEYIEEKPKSKLFGDMSSSKDSAPLRLLKHRFESAQEVDMHGVQVETAAALLIHWIEELPQPLVTPTVFREFLKASGERDPARRSSLLGSIIYHQMNSQSSVVFRYLLSFFVKLTKSSKYSVAKSDFYYSMAVLCGFRRSGSRTKSASAGSETWKDESNQKLFDLLIENNSLFGSPFYLLLLDICSRNNCSPLKGSQLHKLWSGFVLLGMPPSLQSQLTWLLKDFQAALEDRGGGVGGAGGDHHEEEKTEEEERLEQGNSLEQWDSILSAHVMHLGNQIEATEKSLKGPSQALLEVLGGVIGFLKERKASQTKLHNLHILRESLVNDAKKLSHMSKEFQIQQSDIGPSSEMTAAAAVPPPMFQAEMGKSQTVSSLSNSLPASLVAARSNRQITEDSSKSEWNWSNIEAGQTETLSRAVDSLSSLEDHIRGDMMALVKSFARLEQTWGKMKQEEEKIQSELRCQVGQLLPFFEAFKKNVTETEDVVQATKRNQEATAALLQSIEEFLGSLELMIRWEEANTLPFLDREKLMDHAATYSSQLELQCTSEAFDLMRKSENWTEIQNKLKVYQASHVVARTSRLRQSRLFRQDRQDKLFAPPAPPPRDHPSLSPRGIPPVVPIRNRAQTECQTTNQTATSPPKKRKMVLGVPRP